MTLAILNLTLAGTCDGCGETLYLERGWFAPVLLPGRQVAVCRTCFLALKFGGSCLAGFHGSACRCSKGGRRRRSG